MRHSQISTAHSSIAYLQKKCIVAEQMTITEKGESVADFVLNTALYTRARQALKDCTDLLLSLFMGNFSAVLWAQATKHSYPPVLTSLSTWFNGSMTETRFLWGLQGFCFIFSLVIIKLILYTYMYVASYFPRNYICYAPVALTAGPSKPPHISNDEVSYISHKVLLLSFLREA